LDDPGLLAFYQKLEELQPPGLAVDLSCQDAGFRHLRPGDPLPVEEGAADLLLCAYLLERMRKDRLYMLLAEARRVVRPAGHWLLLSRAPARGLKERVLTAGGKKETLIDVLHFISPEDWELQQEIRLPQRGFTARLLLLTRTSGSPVPQTVETP
jgi:hypothetical protein